MLDMAFQKHERKKRAKRCSKCTSLLFVLGEDGKQKGANWEATTIQALFLSAFDLPSTLIPKKLFSCKTVRHLCIAMIIFIQVLEYVLYTVQTQKSNIFLQVGIFFQLWQWL